MKTLQKSTYDKNKIILTYMESFFESINKIYIQKIQSLQFLLIFQKSIEVFRYIENSNFFFPCATKYLKINKQIPIINHKNKHIQYIHICIVKTLFTFLLKIVNDATEIFGSKQPKNAFVFMLNPYIPSVVPNNNRLPLDFIEENDLDVQIVLIKLPS